MKEPTAELEAEHYLSEIRRKVSKFKRVGFENPKYVYLSIDVYMSLQQLAPYWLPPVYQKLSEPDKEWVCGCEVIKVAEKKGFIEVGLD